MTRVTADIGLERIGRQFCFVALESAGFSTVGLDYRLALEGAKLIVMSFNCSFRRCVSPRVTLEGVPRLPRRRGLVAWR